VQTLRPKANRTLEIVVGAPEMDDVAASATSSSAMTSAILWKVTMNVHLG